MDVKFYGNPKPFGIIGLVLAIFSMLFSLIPCIGFYAIVPGFISVIFCFISYSYLKHKNESVAIPLSGLIIGVVAVSIAIYQYYTYQAVFDKKTEIERSIKKMEHEILESVLEDYKENIEKELENDSIQKVEADKIH